jgi:hypothetical protein
MRHRRGVIVVSALQLSAGAFGHFVAVRRRIAYDFTPLGLRGGAEHVGRDSWFLGTGLSAPVSMMTVQALAILRLVTGPSQGAVRVLRVLGLVMIPGYLGERVARRRLTPQGWDRAESSACFVGLLLCPAMAVLARVQSTAKGG